MQDYLIGFPLWIVVSNPRTNPENGKVSFDAVGMVYNANSSAVALFTEELFCERFVERATANDPLAAILQYDDPLELASVLEDQQQRHGHEFVVIDSQSPTGHVPYFRLNDFISTLRGLHHTDDN